jgi:hypothetical protein
MFRFIKKLIRLPLTIKNILSITPLEWEIYNYFNSTKKPVQNNKDVVLLQCVEDPYYFSLFGLVITSLVKCNSMRVDQFVIHSLSVGESESLAKFIKGRLFGRLQRKKWVGLYRSFCNHIGYRSVGFQTPVKDALDFYLAYKCWRNLISKDSLIKLTVDDVLIGDLVNDAFLRFKPSPTVDLKDLYLLVIIWQAYRDISRAKKYFKKVKPKIYLTSYTTYIQHGIATRVALMSGVRVFSFGNSQEFAKELSQLDWFQSKNPVGYSKDFSKLTNLEKKITVSKFALDARISGVIDSATSYMKQSAYSDFGQPVPDVKGAVVVFLHDFYDSPHIYPDMVFSDFWEWTCFTIETLKKANITFVIKPHPNQINLSDNVLLDLKKRYPDIVLISSKITNKQLVKAGVVCAVTVYGTVAHEMAYMGVPTIASARHPHISFDFCKTAKNKIDYAELLIKSSQLNLEKVEMKRQSLIFYYMHNLNLCEEEKLLLHVLSKLRQCYANPETSQPINQLDLLHEISFNPAFNAYISRLI